MRSLYIIPCFVFSFLACTARPLPSLIPYCDGPKWGYADTNGKIVIAPQWDGANFFSGNRAIVFISKGNGSRTQCLIDRTGTYIIPPERQWTGTYIGWQGDLNFTDGNGHWGMIDTNNNVLIPPVWSSARYLYEWRERDSFKIVTKDGLSGVIDRNNRLVVPCEYNGVSSTSNLEKIKGFIVSDPDDNRAMGLYVIGKGLVLPMRYSQVDYVETYDRKGYRVNLSMNNSYRVIKFLDYNTLQPTPDPGQDTMHTAGGYFLTGNPGYAFLLDKKGKWLLPSTYVDSITADTVYTVSYKQTGDSYLVTRKRLRTADLKPYSPAVIKIYYKTPPENYLDRVFAAAPATPMPGI